MISNILNNKNPAPRLSQVIGTNSIVIHIPTASSMTTTRGSSPYTISYFFETKTPMENPMTIITNKVKIGIPGKMMSGIRATKEPAVPGATGE